eukprot:1703580-Pyramimonas_sp.AAC.2
MVLCLLPNAQPLAQPIGDGFIVGRQAQHNLWRNRSDTVLFSTAEDASYGATDKNYCPFDHGAIDRKPSWIGNETRKTMGMRRTRRRRRRRRRRTMTIRMGKMTGRNTSNTRTKCWHSNARGATPDLCSPFGLAMRPKRRADAWFHIVPRRQAGGDRQHDRQGADC